MRTIVALVVCLAAYQASFAHELTTTIGANAEYSDNVRQRDVRNPSGDILSSAFVGIDYQYKFTAVTASADYTVRQLNYRDDSFDDRTDFLGSASVDWQVLPERLSWNLNHSRDRILTDRSIVGTPANEQNRTTVSSGPQFQLNFGRATALFLSSNYVFNETEEVERFTSNQLQNQARLQRPLGSYLITLSASNSEINYDDSSFDYQSQRYSAGLSGAGGQLSWDISLGQNNIDRDTRGTSTGLFYSASLNLEREQLVVGLRTNRELTDNQIGLSLNNNILNPLDNSDGSVGEFDIVERIRQELSVAQRFQRLAVAYSLTRNLQDFQSLTRDETQLVHSLSFRYQQSERLSWNLEMSRQSSSFEVPIVENTRFNQYERRLTLLMKLNTKLDFNTWVSTRRRSVDSGTTQSFKEEMLGVEMTFRL